jgi:signal transduction histidine kinase
MIGASVDQETILFVVEDSGCGIPPAQHESIFDAFEQVVSGPGRNTSGIGLGLAIVRQLTDVLGGTVSVASTPGVGSTFAVRLPLVAASAERDAGELPPVAAPLRRAG